MASVPSRPQSASPRSSSAVARGAQSSAIDEKRDEPLAAAEALLPTHGYLLLRDPKTGRVFYDSLARPYAEIRKLEASGGWFGTPTLNGFEILGSESEASVPCNVYSKNVSRQDLVRRLVAAYDLDPEGADVDYLHSLSKKELCDDVRRIMTQNYYDLVAAIQAYQNSTTALPPRQLVAVGRSLNVPRPLDLVVDRSNRGSVAVSDKARLQRSKARYVQALLAAARAFEPRGFEAAKQKSSHAAGRASGRLASLSNPSLVRQKSRTGAQSQASEQETRASLASSRAFKGVVPALAAAGLAANYFGAFG